MNWKSFLVKVFFVILGAITTYFVTTHLTKDENNMRYLDIVTKYDGLVGMPDELENNITILLGSDTIRSLGRYTVELYNHSDRNYTNVPVYIELYYPSGRKVQVLEKSAYGEEKMYDQVKEIKDLNPSGEKGSFKAAFNINTVNKSKISTPIFTANFFIQGEVPAYKINVDYKGLDERPVDWTLVYKPNWYESDWFIGICAIILYGAVIYAIIKLGNIKAQKRKKKLIGYVIEKLNEEDSFNSTTLITPSVKEKIAKHIFYLRDMYFWENSSKILKFIRMEKEPTEPE